MLCCFSKQQMDAIRIENAEGLAFLSGVPDASVDLVLTDPPYIISRDSGMNQLHQHAQNGTGTKTEEEWLRHKQKHNLPNDDKKQNYMRYGTTYGRKYAVATDYGDWDSSFTTEQLALFVEQFYRKLRDGGTLILFFDLWKLSDLHAIMTQAGFRQIRFIEWIKTNPQPLNSSKNYLTNCREVALVGVKKGKPTFHSRQDNGIYSFPLQGGKDRCHPTQKNTDLFAALIEKHSNPGDLVLDTFLGSGTTAVACQRTNRRFLGCEASPAYFRLAQQRIT